MSAPRRPLWRRLAGYVRRGMVRLSTPIDRLLRSDRSHDLPPAHLRIYYYRSWDPDVFARACEGARFELTSRGLRPQHRVLDIGSGIGNLALALVRVHDGGYDGVEVHGEAVAWCQGAITSRYPTFRFHHVDLASRAYNPGGRAPASTYGFPFPDASFDYVLLGSVFTHMLPADVEQYVREIGRLLAPGGICVSSWFLLNDDTRSAVDAGRSFIAFDVPHGSGVCRLHDAAVPEAAVAYEEAFVRLIHARAGLHIGDVRRGGWWKGERHDQDVLTIVTREKVANSAGV